MMYNETLGNRGWVKEHRVERQGVLLLYYTRNTLVASLNTLCVIACLADATLKACNSHIAVYYYTILEISVIALCASLNVTSSPASI